MLPLRDSHSSRIFPFWIVVIIAINIYIFYLEVVTLTPSFIEKYALIPKLIDFSQLSSLTPFITSQFLHGGILHILTNMWFLWVFGDNVEEKVGFFIFPFFYLFTGAFGAFVQYIFVINSPIPMLGASGAIAGVLGAYFALFPHHKVDTLVPFFGLPIILPIPAFILLIYWLGLQVLSGYFAITSAEIFFGGVAYFAHIGGFVLGWMAGKIISAVG